MWRSIRRMLLVVVLSLGLATMALALEFPKIDRRPAAPNYQWGKPDALAHYDPNSTNPFQMDLRSRDLTGLDLTGRVEDLLHATFDDRTKWPAQIPQGYDYRQIMELGKNPGLGVRELHRQGITGRGVGIAICDQPLLVDHQEYADRLRLYEEINIRPRMEAQMHGPAVASIAVGKTVGVAPEADLYYIGEWGLDWNGGTRNFEYLARSVQRILEINEQLPAERKIRVISISVGWSPSQKGYQQITEAVNKAKAAGMLVISSSVDEVHGFSFHGLGRSALTNPDDVNSYEPGSWWAKAFYQGESFASGLNRLLVPMDARTTASPTGVSEYVFYAQGGWSWSIPYIAGVYALAAQVEPKITPDRFWALALRTGRIIDLHRGGKEFRLGRILDPAGLVAALRRGELADQETVAAELAKYYPTGTPPSRPTEGEEPRVPKDLAARIDKLAIGSATRQDVIALFGEPFSYVRGKERFDASHLPSRFVMLYPGNVQVWVSDDRVRQVMIVTPGYLFRGAIQVGDSKEEVFKVLEPPRKTMEAAGDFDIRTVTENPVFFQDLGGEAGNGYYRNEPEGVGLYFRQGKVMQIYLLPQRQPASVTQ